MPKKYDYFIVLSTNIGVHQASVNLYRSFDHSIKCNDIIEIENAGKNGQVTNFKLLEVTGTFTYLFIFRMTRDGIDYLRSKISVLDHRITSTTLVSDYENEISSLKNSYKSIISAGLLFDILFHQEIPDD